MTPFMINKFTGYRMATASNRKMNNALRLSMKTLNNNFHDNPFELASRSLFIYLKNKLPIYFFQGQLLIQNNKISLKK